jgi:signal peptidase II
VIKKIGYILLFASIVLSDRLTKLWALQTCLAPRIFNAYLSGELVFNRGVSWSFFNYADPLLFGCVTGLVTGVIIALALYAWNQWQSGQIIAGEVMVLAGSCANLFDRFIYGGVIDFILLSYKSYSWPIFNIADIAIVLGVGYMLVNLVWQPTR